MEKEDLLLYEAPTLSESIGFEWGQNIIAKYIGWKINRKWKRYEFRKKRNNFFSMKDRSTKEVKECEVCKYFLDKPKDMICSACEK